MSIIRVVIYYVVCLFQTLSILGGVYYRGCLLQGFYNQRGVYLLQGIFKKAVSFIEDYYYCGFFLIWVVSDTEFIIKGCLFQEVSNILVFIIRVVYYSRCLLMMCLLQGASSIEDVFYSGVYYRGFLLWGMFIKGVFI